ncbi:MAG: hypothetical protein ABEL04_15165 [Salinibacter sp.]|uniref:hypothetical protein n=1 Tax=Salinibacter sp. TaxID=2065818 RepID=UPI0035D51FA7
MIIALALAPCAALAHQVSPLGPATVPVDPATPADTLVGSAPPEAGQESSNRARKTYRPYQHEPSVYFGAPPQRYNRVEGAVVGLQWPLLRTLRRNTPVRPFGQVGYALGLERWRAIAGLEAWLVSGREAEGYGLKAGGHLARTIASEDHWKRSWRDNALSAVLFGKDLYNYYGVRAATVYVVQRISSRLRVTVGGRWAEHRSLPRTIDGPPLAPNAFRPNPPIDGGEVRLGLLSVEAGRLTRRTETRPVGTVARLYAEWGRPWGAPLGYNRAVLHVQTRQAVAAPLNVNVRGRVGWTSDDAPVQTQFRLEGVRGLRTVQPVSRAEERLLLGGATLMWHDAPAPAWMRQARLSTFADLGWAGERVLRNGQTFAFAGIGIDLFDQVLGIEIAWNLSPSTRPDWRPQASLSVNPF